MVRVVEKTMRSVRGIGTWTDDTGKERGAVVGLEVDERSARMTVGAIGQSKPDPLPTSDRRTVVYLGKVEAAIRAVNYANRDIVPDPKPKDRKSKRPKAHSTLIGGRSRSIDSGSHSA